MSDRRPVHVDRDLLDQFLGQRHQVVIIRVGLVELEHRELRIVLRRDAFVAEVAIDLIDAVESADDEALEIELGGDAEEEVDVEGVVMGDERTRHRAAGDGLHHGRLDFDVAAGVEEFADGAQDLGALDEDVADVNLFGFLRFGCAFSGRASLS